MTNIIFLLSQNLFLLKFPKFNLVKVFRGKDENEIARSRIKKEPIINNNLTDNYDVDNFDNKDNTSQTYYSPSLEILETDNSFSKTKVEEENIKTNSPYNQLLGNMEEMIFS